MLFRFVAIALSVLVVLAPARADDKDLKALQGSWAPVSGEFAGAEFPDAIIKATKLVIKDGTYLVTVGKQDDKGTFKLIADKTPKAMDITGTDGPNKGKTFLAIYELDGDSLKICYDLSGKERPTEFKTKTETKLFLLTYKRVKD
jgi:uncharacterized protein (TIGR03067 family)